MKQKTDNLIDPQELIRKYPLEHFNATAERYYQALSNSELLMAKPFIFLSETPTLLRNLAALFDGLQLAKTMTVLDFGAGTCWLSRILAQMECQTISCDVSQTALDLGRRLFREYPIIVIGEPVAEPAFLHFDGRRIALPDGSVDRIVCYDALHHVPNLEEVIAEMARVLKPGGIAGFSEPGRNHSIAPQSQFEMRNYGVLENDIELREIFRMGQDHGFTQITVCAPMAPTVSLDEYEGMINSRKDATLHERLVTCAQQAVTNYTVFFLQKGNCVPDSRSAVGLSHNLSSSVSPPLRARAGRNISIPLRIVNTGNAIWLTQNVGSIGVVHIGLHLYDRANHLVNFEFGRRELPRPVQPGSEIALSIDVAFPEPGEYILAIDLVSERVCWFENRGSKPLLIPVQVN